MGGLQFLAQIIHEKDYSVRLQKKAIILMHDLVINDENIFEIDERMVRRTFGEQMQVLERLIGLLKGAADNMLESPQLWDLREYILRCLFRIFQVCPNQFNLHQSFLQQHQVTLLAKQ
mmetsp:Transcript_17569/g.29658  ORF Transcript_17569/g.29658 Transcript_17569/m.29658 type:complete len:118 (-) Transcript_17569:410-763(-)